MISMDGGIDSDQVSYFNISQDTHSSQSLYEQIKALESRIEALEVNS